MRNRIALVLEIGVPVLLVGLWWLVSRVSDSFYLTPLDKIAVAFGYNWFSERLITDVLPSLYRLLAGFGLSAVLGIGLGMAAGSVWWIARLLEPIAAFLRAVPAPALLPFAVALFGIGDEMKIFLIVMVCVWPILLNTTEGFTGVDRTMVETARSFRVGHGPLLLRVLLPAALPRIMAGLRTALSLAVITMVISELVGSTNGIGFFVLQAQRSFALADMWSGIVLLGIIGYLLNLAFERLERRVVGWQHASRGAAA
ncbi:ABC transporter permease [Spiractinospora alimapuensis]|uniref:ABC transporter permease n=1 Tax=Spiractinospora alimapuensis TaxID=2820884 RepID=UPI001F2F68CA|nr:ABC transporter permease [Spiractinospora alimapuensis]QVQ54501.1 ABC transporter permease [Spiractinospora alimapuensis]